MSDTQELVDAWVVGRDGAATDQEAGQVLLQVVLRLSRGESVERVRAEVELAASAGTWVLDSQDARDAEDHIAPVVDLETWRARRSR